MFFISVASKGLSVCVSGLESTLAGRCVSVDSKGGYRHVFRAFLQVFILNSLRRKPQVEEISPRARSAVRKSFSFRSEQGALFPQSKWQNCRGDGNRKSGSQLPHSKKFRTLTW